MHNIKIVTSIIIVIVISILFNATSVLAVSSVFEMNYLPSKSFVSTGEQVSVDMQLKGADLGVVAEKIEFKDLDNAFEKISYTSIPDVNRPGIDWADSNLLSNFLAFSTDDPTVSKYKNDEIIVTLHFSVKPNFKGKTARMEFKVIQAANPLWESYIVGNNYPTKIVEFHINQAGEHISTVKYSLDPKYTITIPELIVASDVSDNTINIAGDVNLEEGKEIKVTASSGNVILDRYKMDGITKVTGLGAQTIETKLKLGANSNILNTTALAIFRTGKTNLITDALTIQKIDPTNKKAGKYIGNIIFNVNIVDTK